MEASEKLTQTGAHPVKLSALNATRGNGYTMKFTGDDAVHPFWSVTVAVYVPEAVGKITGELPVKFPGFHV